MKFKLTALMVCILLLSSCSANATVQSFIKTPLSTENHPTTATEDPTVTKEPTAHITVTPLQSEAPLPSTTPDNTPTPTPEDTLTNGDIPTVTPNNTPTPTPTSPNKTPYGMLPESSPVEKSYFDDAAFIGDSVSLALKTYSLTGALGNANVFAVGSYSLREAIKPLDEAELYPSYRGKDMTVADCIKACGAKKVYIMFGMNDIAFGIDKSVEKYKILAAQIKEKNPDAEIFIQSMTPMLFSSSVYNKGLSNPKIKEYNRALLDACLEMGWYFVDVASVMYEDTGEQLNKDYCGDKESMGLHLNLAGTKVWVDYLFTHTPYTE